MERSGWIPKGDGMELKNRTFIIFGTEHGNPLGLARTLGENGIAPIGIILRAQVPIASKCRYWKICHVVDTVEEGLELLLRTYAEKDRKGFLFSAADEITQVLDAHYDELRPYYYFNSAGQAGRLSEYMGKANIIRLAQKHGLETAAYWEVDRGIIPEGIRYPVITKAVDSFVENWKDCMIICRNEAELKAAYETLSCPRVLVQRYVDKKNELTLEGLSVQQGKRSAVAVTISFLYLPKDSYGRYMTVKPSENKTLEAKIFSMLEEISYEGLFEAEFLVGQNDELYFLEINFRSSLWNYAATVAGVPLPLAWAQAMLEPEKLGELCQTKGGSFTAMDELNDFRDRVMTHQISFGQWLSDFRGCKCRYYLGKKDPMPMVSMFAGSVGRKMKRVFHRT